VPRRLSTHCRPIPLAAPVTTVTVTRARAQLSNREKKKASELPKR
jgi:hypothetical protein